ncbi:MAG: EAL domain-containing protein [Magnetovibrionaceae bacterium]
MSISDDLTFRPMKRLYLWFVLAGLGIVGILAVMLWTSFQQSVAERNREADLLVRLAETGVTRTLESVETGLLAIADEIAQSGAEARNPQVLHPEAIKRRINQVLRFAPHIRQIALVDQDRALVGSVSSQEGGTLDLERLKLPEGNQIAFSQGLSIGARNPGRFLPMKGDPEPIGRRSYIPVSLNLESPKSYRLIAALNPAYLSSILGALNLQSPDGLVLTDLQGNVLLSSGGEDWADSHFVDLKARMSRLVSSGQISSDHAHRHGGLLSDWMEIRLSEKYPLAISLHIDHSSTRNQWYAANNRLILGLVGSVVLVLVSGIALLRDNLRLAVLEKQIKLLSAATQQSPLAVLIADTENKVEYINPAFTRTFGYTSPEVVGKTPAILKSGKTPEATYEDFWQTINQGTVWQGEFLNSHKDGHLVTAEATVFPVRESDDRISHKIGIFADVTARRESERQIRLAAAVFETATEGIIITDAENRIQLVNGAFSRITGYKPEEVVGQSPAILKSGHHSDSYYRKMYTSLQNQGSWEGEVWNRRKSGEIFPEWLAISIMRDGRGNLEGYVALFSDITKRKQDEEHIRHQANFDSLTGLPNRNLFADRLSRALARADRAEKKVALFFIDLDHFKAVNDTLGHSVGDQLLQEAARRLEKCLRRTDTAARLGGDEFAAILPDLENLDSLQHIASNTIESLGRPYAIEGHEAYVSASIGITVYPNDAEAQETLVRNADSAMYRAKEMGRNGYAFFTLEMSRQAEHRHQIETALHQAVAAGDFVLHYQPIIDRDSGKPAYFEALVRWRKADGSLVGPDDFIQLAEENGLINPIGEWVLWNALEEAARWQNAQGSDAPGISVNLSSRQFQKANIAALVTRHLGETGLNPEKLILEITESLLLAKDDIIIQQLEALRSQGIGIAVDDFGTGYSSISYLKRFPISILKIDKTFVSGLPENAEDRSLVRGISQMADGMHLKVVAEGVETDDQLAFLHKLGCRFTQGYLHGKPAERAEAR